MKKQTKRVRVEIQLLDSYLAVIRNSRGTRMFRNYIARVDGVTRDITEDGDKSCALYVSSVLTLFGLIRTVQVTVHRTLTEMERCGWKKIRTPRKGCVLVWDEKRNGNGHPRKHIGFYIGGGKAISNNSRRGCPAEHAHTTYGGRGILTILWHPALDR